MIGPKAILSSILARVLAAFLKVDPHEIETSLLAAGEKRLTLQNAALKERRIRIRSRDGIITFLVLTGSLQEIVISWSWSAAFVEKSLLILNGIRFEARFEFEADRPDQKTSADAVPLISIFMVLWKDALGNIQNSGKVRKTFSDLIDTLSIQVHDVQVRLILPEPIPSQKTELVLTFDSLRFEALKRKDVDGPVEFLERPLSIEVSINALSLKSVEGSGEAVILDPFTYAASIRRQQGIRFSNMHSGYEFYGRRRQTCENAKKTNTNPGIFLNLSGGGVTIIATAFSLFQGDKSVVDEREEKSTSGHSSLSREPPAERSQWLLRIIYMLILAALGAFSILWQGFAVKHEKAMIWAAAASLITMLGALKVLDQLRQTILRSSRAPRKGSTAKNPATFRIPLPFVTVVGPMDFSVTFSKISILGQLDGEFAYIVADGLNCGGGDTGSGPLQISAKGIRSTIKPGAILLNIDTISEIFHPSRFKLMQPILYSVLRFENGVLTTKWRTIDFQMFSHKTETDRGDDASADASVDPMTELVFRFGSFIEKTRDTVRNTGQQINMGIHKRVRNGVQGIGEFTGLTNGSPTDEDKKEEELRNQIAREQVYSELFARRMMLKAVAEMLESIPLSKNRYRLRAFKNTFRGNEAVDYLLKCKITESRLEATKVLRDIQIQFRLFEHVTKAHNFRDARESIFHFVDERYRRMWEDSSTPFKYTEVDQEKVVHVLPFPAKIFFRELVVRVPSEEEPVIYLHGGEIYGEPALLAHANVLNMFIATVEHRMLAASNLRVQAVINPDLIREVHGLEVSVDSLHASPEHTSDDWYEKLGFVRPPGDAPMNKRVQTDPFSLPYMYVAPFNFQLSWKGVIFAAKSTSIGVEAFSGEEHSTSNDLIAYFIMRVLSRAPGLLANFRVLGVNIMEKSGIVSALTVGAKTVPFGQYLAIGGMAIFDGVTTALDNGKTARNDAGGSYKPGDLVRGVVYSAQEAARSGARTRGKKVDDSYYDEGDEVKLNSLDFAVGATQITVNYVYSNKARFVGATVASATVVALTVATGPIAGIVLGVGCGILAEKAIKKAEKRFERNRDREKESESDDFSLADSEEEQYIDGEDY